MDRLISRNEAEDPSSVLTETCGACGCLVNTAVMSVERHHEAAHAGIPPILLDD